MTSINFVKRCAIKSPLLAKKHWPYLAFLAWWLLVVWPWFAEPGFLFLLDFVSPPQLSRPPAPWQTYYISGWLYNWTTWGLSQAMPAAVVQKIMFSLPLFIAGVAMYQLSRWLFAGTLKNKIAMTATFAAGLFYAYNPFVTTRVYMGHVLFLYAYALTPWILLAWLKFLQQPSARRAFGAGLTIMAALFFSAHHFILIPLLILFFLRPASVDTLIKKFRLWFLALLPVIALVCVALSLYYLAPWPPNKLHPLGPWARALLAPYSGSYVFDVLNLSATWKIDLPFFFPWELRSGFGLAAALLLAVMVSGLYWLRRQENLHWLASRFALVVLVSVILAIGVAHPITAPAAGWLYRHVPFWLGMRDSAKFMALTALAESILLGAGMLQLKKYAAMTAVVITMLPVLFITSTALYGYNNQIYPLDYPDSWSQAQNWLADNHQNPPRVLFLPWHMYLPFSFTNYRTIANPAAQFFTAAEVVYGNNNEVGGTFGRPFIEAENSDSEHQYIQDTLDAGFSGTDFGARLAPLGVEYIMLATDTRDAADYDFLYRQNDLEMAWSQTDLILWRNNSVNAALGICSLVEG